MNAGQIMLLRKLQGNWDRSNGVSSGSVVKWFNLIFGLALFVTCTFTGRVDYQEPSRYRSRF